MTPTAGVWQTVAAASELPEGAVRAFDLGTVAGFVQRADGIVQRGVGLVHPPGLPARLDAAARNLDCPCHTTVFALTGELVTPPAARRTPHRCRRFATREVDGAVQVFAP